MSVITFDVAEFRASFPAFGDMLVYTDALLQGNFDSATVFVNPNTGSNWYIKFTDSVRKRCLYLMTAHLTQLGVQAAAGQTPGQVQSSTIDKVSVTLTPPPNVNQWQWWLGLTAYGQQLLALLKAKSAGGFYIGGLPELGAFRRVGGAFIP